MDARHARRLLLIVLLCGLAFGLRIYRLDASPLRGDEAFAVRYWAADPLGAEDDLNHREPHPFGTFFSFWAWEQLAGDSEFAMRFLPLLGNVLGVAAMWALARRLFRDTSVAALAAALWAVNPFLIWHAQDARNYALWAAFSPLALWLFLRAAASNRPRDWTLYVAAEALALYTFFLEAFLLPVQVIYLLIFRRAHPVSRRAARAWIALGLLLIPWFIQLYWLSGSGYSGTLDRANPAALLTGFLPTLLVGQQPAAPWDVILPLAWIALVALLWWNRPRRVAAGWLVTWILLPTALLLIAATRMSVFDPRYLIAVTPAPLLLTARALVPSPSSRALPRPVMRIAQLALAATLLPGFATLYDDYTGASPKAPDWPALARYFEQRTGPMDLIVFPAPDPTFNYYYTGGPAAEISLTPGDDPADALTGEAWRDAIWLVGDRADAAAYLDATWQRISRYAVAGFPVTQYRPREVSLEEIQQPVGATFGNVAHLLGYTLQGPTPDSNAVTVLLYWTPLAQTEVDYTVFTHLTGPVPAPDGSPLWAQDDHPPAPATTAWTPDTLLREAFTLLVNDTWDLPPGEFRLEVGLYDPATGDRVPITGAHGEALGDSLPLATIRFPAP